jgi:hypothetical protein
MQPHDCTGLNDAPCLHADHFFLRFHYWRDRGISDELRARIARGDAQQKYPLEEHERLVMDEYLRERVELRKAGPKHENLIELIPVDYVVM